MASVNGLVTSENRSVKAATGRQSLCQLGLIQPHELLEAFAVLEHQFVKPIVCTPVRFCGACGPRIPTSNQSGLAALVPIEISTPG